MNKKQLKQIIDDLLSKYFKVTNYNGGITISNKIKTLHFEIDLLDSIMCFENSKTGTIVEFIAYTRDELIMNLIKLKGDISSE